MAEPENREIPPTQRRAQIAPDDRTFVIVDDAARELLNLAKALLERSPAHGSDRSAAIVLPAWVPVHAYEPPPPWRHG